MAAENTHPKNVVETQCCIAGGGPAGMMLGFLLARAGVDVWVLEKHADFLRDFRGDTIHPSTLEVMYELGLLDELLERPHQKAPQLAANVGDVEVVIADFANVPTRCRFIALMPQWDFLDFLAGHGRRYPTFHLKMEAEVTALVEESGRVAGVRALTPEGPLEVRAPITVGADGRRSTVRAQADLVVETLSAPIDVLWMRISRAPTDPARPFGRLDQGKMLVLIYRGDYWQCGYVIPKGGNEVVRSRGLEAFRQEIAALAPFLKGRVAELDDWEKIKLLSVSVDRLKEWCRPGLLCIGDAAHAMSPVGGVGINLAIQDAVATANILASSLRDGTTTLDLLQRVQNRRSLPTRVTQALQVFAQNRILGRVLGARSKLSAAWPVRLVRRWPFLSGIPARLIGVGVRPEHVKTPDAFAEAARGL